MPHKEEDFRFLFENMPQGAFFQRADGVLVDVNPAALNIFGLTRDEFLGRTSKYPSWKVINNDGKEIDPEDYPSMLALKTGEPIKNIISGVYNPKSQTYNWININAIPQFEPGEDTPFQVFVTLDEITEQKLAEEMLTQLSGSGFTS